MFKTLKDNYLYHCSPWYNAQVAQFAVMWCVRPGLRQALVNALLISWPSKQLHVASWIHMMRNIMLKAHLLFPSNGILYVKEKLEVVLWFSQWGWFYFLQYYEAWHTYWKYFPHKIAEDYLRPPFCSIVGRCTWLVGPVLAFENTLCPCPAVTMQLSPGYWSPQVSLSALNQLEACFSDRCSSFLLLVVSRAQLRKHGRWPSP